MAVRRSAAALALALVAGALLLDPAAAKLSSNNSITLSTRKRNVCVMWYTAVAECDPTKAPDTYTGYEVELFRKVAEWMTLQNQTEWSDYTFSCLTDWDAMMADIAKTDNTRQCDMITAGIHIVAALMDSGIRFSAPTYSGGSQIMIYAPAADDIFAFLKPFSAGVWLAIFATSAFVATFATFMEVPLRRMARNPRGASHKWMNLQWASAAMLLQAMQQFNARTTGARFAILGFAFLILIIINTYIAVLSSQLTINSINLNINSINDLLSKTVGVFVAELQAWKRDYNLKLLVALPWATSQDEDDMVRMLRARELDAIILDKQFVDYRVATSCDLYAVGDLLRPYSTGFVFPPDTALDYLALFNQGLYTMQENGVMAGLENSYIKVTAGCPGKKSGDLANAQIDLKQIAGLFVFLGAATGLGIVCNILLWIWDRMHRDGSNGLGSSASFGGAAGGNEDDQGLSRAASTISLKGRSASMIKNDPDLAWASVADASTAEEGLELVEGLIKQMDRRIKTLGANIDSKLGMLCDAMSKSGNEPSKHGAYDAGDDAGPQKTTTVVFGTAKDGPVPPVAHEPLTPFTAAEPPTLAGAGGTQGLVSHDV